LVQAATKAIVVAKKEFPAMA